MRPLALLRTLALVVAAALAAAFSPAARADDIDLFANVTPNNQLPNVLIIWDSSANWDSDIPVPDCSFNDGTGGPKANNPNKEQGKKFAIEKCAIYNVIDALPVASDGSALVNVALMLFNESGSANSGYPRVRFLPMNATYKATMKNAIRGITIGGDKGNSANFAAALHEAYLIFLKERPWRGTEGTKWDPEAVTPTGVANGHYVGPIGNGCGRNHIIFVANGHPQDNNTQMKQMLASVGGDTTALTYPFSYIVNSDQSNWADEYTRFLRGVDLYPSLDGGQNIITHSIAVIGASSDGLYPNFMRAMAVQGGGQYFAASDATQLTKFLMDLFNSIISQNSVFASASLPISVNAQETYKNQVFVGLFRPEANGRPRWFGNLKQYQFAYDAVTDTLQLADSNGNGALNSGTGFFLPTAVSFWTTDSTFWVNNPSGTPKSASDLPDGEVVEKGATGERQRIAYATAQTSRNVLTCIACSSGPTPLTGTARQIVTGNSAITQAMLGAASSTERDAIINWIRGTDNNNDELGPGGTTTVRPSIHGDVLHSRPAVIDYGGTIGVVAFYGANDGTLRAVSGNKTGTGAGDELWAFVPEEHLGKFKRFRDNAPEIRFPSTPATADAAPRDYFVDGPVTVYQRFDSSGNVAEVVIYVTMRRGGRQMYAFDVTTPTAPQFLWRVTNATSGFGVLGQTWSEPRLARLKGVTDPVLIVGAGYDPAEDLTLGAPATIAMGNAVLIMNARTGALIATLGTDRPVPGSVALLDVDYDGYVDRAYAVDLGANVYRLDFETAAGVGGTANYVIHKFATLNNGGGTRKLFYAADLIQTRDFVAVQMGSGNRERPLLDSTDDQFFTVFDWHMSKGWSGASPITAGQLEPYGTTTPINSSLAGCYLALNTGGEKVVTSAVSGGGNTYFSTNTPTPPNPNACGGSLGLAKGYKLPNFCGVPVAENFEGGGLPPSPVMGKVVVDVPPVSGAPPGSTPSERTVTFCIGCPNPQKSPLGGVKVPIPIDPTRQRIYWYTQPSR